MGLNTPLQCFLLRQTGIAMNKKAIRQIAGWLFLTPWSADILMDLTPVRRNQPGVPMNDL
jgi:hypothetical protein